MKLHSKYLLMFQDGFFGYSQIYVEVEISLVGVTGKVFQYTVIKPVLNLLIPFCQFRNTLD